MQATFAISERGKDVLLLEGGKFTFSKTLKSNESFWRCAIRTCKAKVWTVGAEKIISRSDLEHNHCSNTKLLNRQIVSSSAKRKATEDITEKPSKVIHSAIKENVKNMSTLTVRDMSYIRNNIYTERKKKQPKLPKTAEDTIKVLQSSLYTTIKGENFVSVVSEEQQIIVFSCETNLQALCSLEKIYLDGTFDYCLNFFLQLFTFHVLVNGHYIPLVFCALPNKQTKTYEDVFKLVQQKCCEIDLIFKPKYVVVDFEKGIHNALVAVWPEVKLIGCRFHLAQSWFRKIQQLGLVAEYRNPESEAGKWLNYVFGLPFLEPCEVSDCFTLDLMTIQPVDAKIIQFSDYLVENYIDSDSLFPPELWSSFSASMERTTNACEAFHSKFNSNFYKTHPSLFMFLNVLLEFQTNSYIKLQSVNENIRTKDPETRHRHEFLKTKIN